jgi:phage-related protein
MAKLPGKASRKPLHWVGSSRDALCEMPEEVRRDFGRRLNLAQRGRVPPATKPWHGAGAGVFEMVREFDTDAFRAVYVVRFEEAIYVLRAFQKKSPKGRQTETRDIAAVEAALRGAAAHHQAFYRREKRS